MILIKLKHIKKIWKRYENITNKLTPKQKKYYELLKFFTKLTILAIPLYVIENQIPLQPLELTNAQITSGMLKISGLENNLTIETIPIIELKKMTVGIDKACTGYRSLIAFISLVIATPKIKYNKKIKVILLFIPILFTLNILRIYTTIIISLAIGMQYFELIHQGLWRWGLMLLIIFSWTAWVMLEKFK